MEQHINQLRFIPAGQIVLNEVGSLTFKLNSEFIGSGRHAKMRGWVYLWAKVEPVGQQFNIAYVGKAGGTLRSRLMQHTGGFLNSTAGRRNAERIREYFSAGSGRHQLHVYARKSPDVELLGESEISLCEAEERAMITLCIRRKLDLWNYQAAKSEPAEKAYPSTAYQPASISLPQDRIEGIDDEVHNESEEQGGVSREDAFIASISDSPSAKEIVGELVNTFSDRSDVGIRYSFTNGADMRIFCRPHRGGKPVNVATIRWQTKRDGRKGFGALLFIPPESARATGASEASDRYSGQPRTVRSRAFFEVISADGALLRATHRSIEEFKREDEQ